MDKFIEVRPIWYNGSTTTLLNIDHIIKVSIIDEETYLIRTSSEIIELPMDDYNMSIMTQVFNLKVGE
jgi:hypothetical protein